MKMADVLHSIADLLDKHESDGDIRVDNMGKEASDFQHEVQDGADTGNHEVDLTGVMVPPLQQKLELLKKATGVDNMFDNEGGADELDDIKKLTGIKAVIHADDEPFGE
jgi:hypothetical protein